MFIDNNKTNILLNKLNQNKTTQSYKYRVRPRLHQNQGFTSSAHRLQNSRFSAEREKMGHSNIWNSHPKNYGPGSRTWFVQFRFSFSNFVFFRFYPIANPSIVMQPGLRKPPWNHSQVRSHVLQTVLPQQRQGDWLHQGRFFTVFPPFWFMIKFLINC